jgi:NADH:ubiquinone oxidoreductase subunit 4 (subunit M)
LNANFAKQQKQTNVHEHSVSQTNTQTHIYWQAIAFYLCALVCDVRGVDSITQTQISESQASNSTAFQIHFEIKVIGSLRVLLLLLKGVMVMMVMVCKRQNQSKSFHSSKHTHKQQRNGLDANSNNDTENKRKQTKF